MTGMRKSVKVMMRCFRARSIVRLIRILALEVRREHRMDSTAVNVTRIPMTMIRLGMHMEEWNHEHPHGRLYVDQHSKTR